jgi:hypothetical protein
MGVPKETESSIDLPVSTAVAWQALARAARADETRPGATWHLGRTDVAIDSATPGEGAGGSGSWNGVDYRVAAHLVPQGVGRTLLLLTADPGVEQHGLLGDVHVSASHRHARRDLEALAAATGAQVEAGLAD